MFRTTRLRFRFSAAGVLWIVAAQACESWHRRPELTPEVLPPRQRVQVWQHGQADEWHAVVISADSISGIPSLKSVTCQACRHGVPRDSVDSLRLGRPAFTIGFWPAVAIVVAVPLLLFGIACLVEALHEPPGSCVPQET